MLRYILFGLLLCSACWGSLVVFGAAAVKKISKVYFGETIILHHVKVSPTLTVSIGRLDFDFETKDGSHQFSGTALGLDFELTLFQRKPYLGINATKVELSNWGSINVGSIHLIPKSIIDLNRSNLQFFARSVKLDGFGKINNLTLVSAIDFEMSELQQATIESSNFKSVKTSYPNAESILGSIDRVSFGQKVSEQSLTGDFYFKGITNAFEDVFAIGADLKFAIKDRDLSTRLVISKIQTDTLGLSMDELIIINSLDAKNFNLNKPIQIDSKSIQSESLGLKIEDATAQVMSADGLMTITSMGNILNFELNLGGQYLGRADDTAYKVAAETNLKGDQLALSADLQFDRHTSIPAKLVLKVDSKFNTVNLPKCALADCSFEKLNFDYYFDLEGELLAGTSRCGTEKCSPSTMMHKISIQNTSKFFGNLGKAEIFSPFILAFLFSNAMSGEPTETGHIISLP